MGVLCASHPKIFNRATSWVSLLRPDWLATFCTQSLFETQLGSGKKEAAGIGHDKDSRGSSLRQHAVGIAMPRDYLPPAAEPTSSYRASLDAGSFTGAPLTMSWHDLSYDVAGLVRKRGLVSLFSPALLPSSRRAKSPEYLTKDTP